MVQTSCVKQKTQPQTVRDIFDVVTGQNYWTELPTEDLIEGVYGVNTVEVGDTEDIDQLCKMWDAAICLERRRYCLNFEEFVDV